LGLISNPVKRSSKDILLLPTIKIGNEGVLNVYFHELAAYKVATDPHKATLHIVKSLPSTSEDLVGLQR
jgi:hypothetical protein